MQKTHGEEPSSWFISVIFQCMKKGLRPNGYFPLTRQPLFSKTGNAHFVNLLVRSSGRFALLNRISFSTSTRISLRCPVLHALLRKAKRASYFHSLLFCKTGNVLFSQAVARQVSSALESLTSVFEMGTGGSSPPLSPDFLAPLFHDILCQFFLPRLS